MNTLLSPEEIEKIETMAETKLVETYSDQSFDYVEILNRIIERENLKLREADLQEISGVLYRDKGDWVILVNREDSQKRKLFTIAHELGHYFLHKNEEEEFIDGQLANGSFGRSEATKYQKREIEANEFAGNLIMPKVQIEKTLGPAQKAGPIPNEKIIEVAMRFQVSPHAMLKRLKNLNYGV